jgi:O-antigen/teichoic acid export membrane protein
MTQNDKSDHHDVHSTVRTVSLGTLLRVLRYPVILLSVAIIPRMMGDTEYGKYAYFMSIFVILDIFTDLGFFQIFGRFVPETEPEGHEKTCGLFHGILIYGVLLAAALVIGLVVVVSVFPIQSLTWHWVIILSMMLLLTRLEGMLFSFLYGLNHIARFSSKEVIRSSFTFILVVGFYWQFGLVGALWALVLNEAILFVIGAWWTRDYLFSKGSRMPFSELKPYMLFGLQFYIPVFLFGMLQRSGNVFVQGFTHSPEEVAYYDIANQFLLLTATFLGQILQTLIPSLTKLHIRQEIVTIQRWQRIVMTYCGIATFLAFNALMWLGEPVIIALLGADFAPVIPSAKIIVLAMVPMLIAYAGMNYSVLDKTPGIYTKGVTAGIACMTLASILLTPKFGAVGAAWATVIGYGALGLTFYIRYFRFFVEVLKHFWIAVIVAICFMPFYRADVGVSESALLFIGTSVLYVGILVVLRVVRWSDGQKVLAAFRTHE